MNNIRFTKEGFKKLKDEYAELQKSRPPVVEDLKKAREMGDLKENGYYKASRAKLSFIDGRLSRISYYLKMAVIIDDGTHIDEGDGRRVNIGSVVTLSNGQKETTYQIVGDLEADPTHGKLSLLSPIGQAIENKSIGSNVEIKTPSGQLSYTLVKVL